MLNESEVTACSSKSPSSWVRTAQNILAVSLMGALGFTFLLNAFALVAPDQPANSILFVVQPSKLGVFPGLAGIWIGIVCLLAALFIINEHLDTPLIRKNQVRVAAALLLLTSSLWVMGYAAQVDQSEWRLDTPAEPKFKHDPAAVGCDLTF